MAVSRNLYTRIRRSRAGHTRTGCWTALVIVLLTTAGLAEHGPSRSDATHNRRGQTALDARTPTGPASSSDIVALPALARAHISAAIGKDDATYHVMALADGFRMAAAERDVSAEFTPAGVEFRSGTDRWGLALRGYGYSGTLRGAGAVTPDASGNRVEYHRGALTEWYVNGPLGLEQGFTLAQAPGGANGDPLTLAFALSGQLSASVDPGARSVTLRKDRIPVFRYGGLNVVDADRHELRAWLEMSSGELRIRVDDAGARYPLIIDPYVLAVRLTTVKPCDLQGVCDDGAPYDNFGYSVSISADASTVVVGVPFKYTNSVQTGAAYVFVRPSDYEGGWNSFYPIFYKAKLLASDGATSGRRLGWSVDVSRDGGTIVAGAPRFPNGKGAAYVFERPSYGWGTNPIQTQTARLAPVYDYNQRTTGTSVSISGDGGTIAVGAPDDFGMAFAATYVFDRFTGGVDTYETESLQRPLYTLFGSSVALSDDGKTLAVGAMGENPSGGTPNQVGVAHVFTRDPQTDLALFEVGKLIPSDGAPSDLFGFSISTSGDGSVIVVGAPVNAQDDTVPHAGGAYVFVRPASGWGPLTIPATETAKLTAAFGWDKNHLGRSVDISADGTTIIAGGIEPPVLPGTVPGPGTAYLFGKPPGGWSTSGESAQLFGQYDTGDEFGASVAVSGDGHVSFVGAPHETFNANVFQGATYVFTGSAVGPVASVSPSSLTFGSTTVGATSSPQTVTMTNSGGAPLHVTSVAANTGFVTTQNCVSASPIPSGGQCSESVAFAPLAAGSIAGALTVVDDSGGITNAIQQVQLQGNAVKAATVTTITSVSPSPVLVGRPVTVSYSVVSVTGVTISPAPNFIVVQASTGESCNSNGTDQGSCTLNFTTPGTRTITATYSGDANFYPSTSAGASVKVVDVSLSVSPASQTVNGKKASFTLTVAAVNGFSGTVSLGCSVSGPDIDPCQVVPSSVTLSGSTATAKATVTLPNRISNRYTVYFTASFPGGLRTTTATVVVN
jgi:hypothetical protein